MIQLTVSQQRRKASAKIFKAIRRGWRKAKNLWPERDKTYRTWIATQPCTLGWKCFCANVVNQIRDPELCRVECAHTGSHGISQKATDYDSIPLCRWSHQEAKNAQGKRRTWFEDNGLNRDVVLFNLRVKYEQERV